MGQYNRNSNNLDQQKADSPANPDVAMLREKVSEVNATIQPIPEMQDILNSQQLSLGYRAELQGRLVRVLDNLKSNDIRKTDSKGADVEKTPRTITEILCFHNQQLVIQNNELSDILDILEQVI